MRILHVGKFYAPHKGGMETALRLMAEGSIALGHEVRVVVAGHRRREAREDLPEQEGGLVRLGSLGVWNSQPVTPRLAAELEHQLLSFRPQIVTLHTPNPLASLAWLRVRRVAAQVGATLTIWHHSDIVRQKVSRRLVAPFVRRALEQARGVAVSSEYLRESSRELAGCRDRVRVIPFGIDPTPFTQATPSGDGPFLFVGRLVAYKGLDILFDALNRLPDARLDIAGEGPLRDRLARRLRDEGLAHRVRLLGEVSDQQLAGALASSRALVLPSRDHSETFGLILLEAMAAGLPLIASDLPTGVRDLVQPGQTGWLAEPGDVDDLTAALRACLADPAEARRRGAASRALVLDRFSRDRFATDLVGWYEHVCAQGDATGTRSRVPG